MKKPDFKYVKKRIHELCGIGDEIHFLYVDKKRQEKELEEECSKLLGLKALDALEHVSVEELKNSKAGIRVAVLQEAGYDNLLQLAKLKDWELVSIDGIGEKQAQAIRNVIAEFLNSMAKHVHITFSLGKTEDGEIPNAELLLAIAKLKKCNHVREEAEGLEEVLDANFNDAVEHIEIQSGMHWLVSSRDAKERTVKAVQDLESFMLGKDCTRAKALIQLYHEMTNLTIEQALGFYQAESADFYALLEKYGGTAKENPLIYSSIPAQLAAAIEESPIDLRYFKGNLRAYQLFGAKYILFERRVLLGDEMGLGKTVQAIAAMCDVYAQDPLSRFLVICPASVLINWCREIKKFSAMEAWLIHGAYVDEKFDAWRTKGGVAVTNFETMEKIVRDIDGKLRIAMLVIDEAHYIKNPDARRTQNVRALDDESDRILMMTGTPLENRVEEMCSLIEFLRPDMVEEVRRNAFMSHVPQFRELLAPVYLRRQREQVLEELPPIEEMREWCALTDMDRVYYAQAVTEKNFNVMRRVSFLQGDLESSSKALRLLEICKDAKEDGRKVIIYSFFRETIDKVQQLLGEDCIGVITGNTEIPARQGMIDKLKDAPAGSVLVCQIQAGGTGLNIQVASVVIFCEPQIKPSLTNQAISRVYRMGQVRNVLIYHLLCENTVDEAMVMMLERKQQEFDAYADESALANALDELVDKDWIQKLIEAENEKYGEGSDEADASVITMEKADLDKEG
jgi:superfamily II DNA or RNA helicase